MTLLDLMLAGSRMAAWFGVALIAAAVAALWWLAIWDGRRPTAVREARTPRLVDANAVRGHRAPSQVARPVRYADVERTAVVPVLRDQTELIPRVGGGGRG